MQCTETKHCENVDSALSALNINDGGKALYKSILPFTKKVKIKTPQFLSQKRRSQVFL